ncbi:MAG TPA: GAF and ANTAR domain-containing protein [Jatrophihabitantaceae bacterium]|nr:GAF and ANTAR domain-containing protein [Jatrophihabitantaceae bacterium]
MGITPTETREVAVLRDDMQSAGSEVVVPTEPVDLARFADVDRQLAGHCDMDSALAVLTEIAAREVAGAQYAGVTLGSRGRFRTIAPTDEIVTRVDQIQYDLGTGPCVDAALEDNMYYAPDLRDDPRWPDFGVKAAEATGILSMLTFRMYLEHDDSLVAAINMYSTEPKAFAAESRATGLLLATHGALAVSGAAAREKAMNLERALETSRDIGVAMGVLMKAHSIEREQAFDLLRISSQHTHRKLSDVAAEVARTGVLPSTERRKDA